MLDISEFVLFHIRSNKCGWLMLRDYRDGNSRADGGRTPTKGRPTARGWLLSSFGLSFFPSLGIRNLHAIFIATICHFISSLHTITNHALPNRHAASLSHALSTQTQREQCHACSLEEGP